MKLKGEYVKEYLGKFDESHPLILQFKINPDYMEYFDKLLSNLINVPNLENKINELRKDKGNWESYISELKFCNRIIQLEPKFIPSKGEKADPDLEIELDGEKIFFEVKLLSETDESKRVYKELFSIRSDYIVIINYDILTKEKADKLIEAIKERIYNKKTGEFRLDFADIKIIEKNSLSKKSGKKNTYLIMTTRETAEIERETLKRKLLLDFYKKIKQFNSGRKVFWVLDIDRWKYSVECVKEVFHGTTTYDLSGGLSHYVGFEKIYKYFDKNPEIVQSTDIMPKFIYPNKDGLIFNDDFKILNGIVAFKENKMGFFINPFAENQIDIQRFRKLKNFFEKGYI